MDNPARTAEYIARRAARCDDLKRTLTGLLAGRKRITLEIGAGHGHFLTDYATAHPEEFCIGVDIVRDRVERATRKRDRAKLSNLVFLLAEAGEFLGALPADVAFQRVFVLFPDPWPKRRHHKNRLMQAEFLSTIATRAEKAAHLCFRTDHAAYFAAAKAEVLAHPDWEVLPEAPWPFERVTVFQSRAPAYESLVAARRSDAAK
ncbi:MAG: methyltransferase domain-containing protein [Nibricoccus sp.]